MGLLTLPVVLLCARGLLLRMALSLRHDRLGNPIHTLRSFFRFPCTVGKVVDQSDMCKCHRDRCTCGMCLHICSICCRCLGTVDRKVVITRIYLPIAVEVDPPSPT